MPKKKVAVSELVRETAGLVLSMLVVRNYQTAQLLMATGQSRLTLMRAIRYLRAKGVRIYWVWQLTLELLCDGEINNTASY